MKTQVDFRQIKSQIGQCTAAEKIELVQMLEKETFPIRFRQLLARMKNDELTMEDITSEVESVRESQYYARQKD